jgi:hypothetical protein
VADKLKAAGEFPLSVMLDVFQSIQRKGIPFMLVLTGLPTLIQSYAADGAVTPVPVDAITQKLDSDFFAGRWARVTERQRQLLWAISQLDSSGGEFTVQQIVDESNRLLSKPFGNSHTNQMLSKLSELGLIYKNRWGRYSFAVPLFDRFIQRQALTIQPELLA